MPEEKTVHHHFPCMACGGHGPHDPHPGNHPYIPRLECYCGMPIYMPRDFGHDGLCLTCWLAALPDRTEAERQT